MQLIRNQIPYINLHTLERWASVGGGMAVAISGLRKGPRGILRILTGAAMVKRGLTGRCEVYRLLGIRTADSHATIPSELGVRARAAVTVNQPRDKVFQFWRQIENLPRFMQHLVSVEPSGRERSHWVARGPANSKVEWTAEIINEIPDKLIAWKSLPGGDVDSAGSVRFSDAPGGRGTEIRVELQYNPPAGIVGAWVASLLGGEPEQEIKADLARLKQYLESGEMATIEGQPKFTPSRQRGASEDRRPSESVGRAVVA